MLFFKIGHGLHIEFLSGEYETNVHIISFLDTEMVQAFQFIFAREPRTTPTNLKGMRYCVTISKPPAKFQTNKKRQHTVIPIPPPPP